MTSQDFEAFKDFILSTNPYFVNGYANVFKDSETGYIFARNGQDFINVFPMDYAGAYFYLRNESGINFREDYNGRVQDCGAGRLAFNDTVVCQIVAVVSKANGYDLINNLRNTAMMFTGMNAIPTAAIWVREEVVVNEMAKSSEDELMAALQRLKDETIVRVTVSITKPYVTGTCIIDVCNEC